MQNFAREGEFEGLNLALNIGSRRVLVECDNMVVMKMITRKYVIPLMLYNMVEAVQ